MGKRSVGTTLIELLVSILIFSMIVITLSTISVFSYRSIIDAARRSDLQQDVSYVIEHVTKNVQSAIGSPVYPGLRTSGPPNYYTTAMRIDRNRDGIPNDNSAVDWVAYNYVPASYRVDYIAQYDPATWPAVGVGEALSSKISVFTLVPQSGTSHVFILVTACFDPDGIAPDGSSVPCGTKGNPSVSMSSNIDTPMISYQ